MPNGHVLELSTLPACQPLIGDAFLDALAPAAIIRFWLDPTPLPTGTMSKEVTVSWSPKAKNQPAQQLQLAIGWSGIADLDSKCAQHRRTFNDHDLNEKAAIAVMALLIHDCEGGTIQRVLPIGSGGDYHVITRGARKLDQIEVSGIRTDVNGSESKRRLKDKSDQVLTHCKAGFVSVTTFSHSRTAIVYSYLCFVRRTQRKKPSKKRKRRK